MNLRPGSEFADADVVKAYGHRAPYPPALFARLLELSSRRGRALDLGCGPGKLAIGLADSFREVVAVDPSAAMIATAKALGGRRVNIQWIEGLAEDAPLTGPFDLATAGASIHWMEHGVLFPNLADLLSPDAVLVVADGDAPAEAPWFDAYIAVISGWVEKLGGTWNGPEHRSIAHGHEAWMDIEGREAVWGDCRMALEDLIDGEHSRATWARTKMGPERAAAFDADLRAVLAPFADDGMVSFRTLTRLSWGRPRRAPKPDHDDLV